MILRRPDEVGLLVRDRRLAAGMTQAALGTAVGSSREWVGLLEAGNPGAELGRVLRVLAALGITLDAQVSGAPRPPDHVGHPRGSTVNDATHHGRGRRKAPTGASGNRAAAPRGAEPEPTSQAGTADTTAGDAAAPASHDPETAQRGWGAAWGADWGGVPPLDTILGEDRNEDGGGHPATNAGPDSSPPPHGRPRSGPRRRA